MSDKILVIKLGALGDLVLCMDAFAALRAKHPQATLALLTGPSFVPFAREMPWFDDVLTDPRPAAWNVTAWARLIRAVRAFGPTRVYDFQGKPRQSILYWALGGPLRGPEWSGAARGCSHPRQWPPVEGMHYTEFLSAQLERADVRVDQPADLTWLDDSLDGLDLPQRYALFIPGCAATRLYKRWPPEHYAALAEKLAAKGLGVFAVGTKADEASIEAIRELAPSVVSLAGQTTLKQLAALARRAVCVVGNDTGPTHLSAAVGAKTIALMSDKVDPHWSAPEGARTKWLQGKPLSSLSVSDVWQATGL